MRQKVKLTGKDNEIKIQIEATILTAKYALTRGEAKTLKNKLTDKLFDVLRETNYYTTEIRRN